MLFCISFSCPPSPFSPTSFSLSFPFLSSLHFSLPSFFPPYPFSTPSSFPTPLPPLFPLLSFLPLFLLLTPPNLSFSIFLFPFLPPAVFHKPLCYGHQPRTLSRECWSHSGEKVGLEEDKRRCCQVCHVHLGCLHER